MKTTRLLILILFFGHSLISSAQVQNNNPLKSRLDSIVHQAALDYLKNTNRVSFSIGFISGKKSYRYHYGETAPGAKIAPTDRSIYEIGSITKTFTGLLVAQAVEEGKMDLHADIRKYLPGSYPNLQYPNGSPVKLIYLLAHVAKFPGNFPDQVDKTSTAETYFLSELGKIKLDSLKSYRYAYSNVGYKLLGYLLEKVYQQSYKQLVQKYIAGPLNMPNTKVNYPISSQVDLLSGYTAARTKARHIEAELPAAGALRATLPDMLNYLRYQMDAKDDRVRFTHKITSGDIDNGAHGVQWAIGKLWNWDYYLQTDGGTYGFRSFCMIYPDDKMGFIVLSNQTDESAGGGLYRITAAIYNELKKQRNGTDRQRMPKAN